MRRMEVGRGNRDAWTKRTKQRERTTFISSGRVMILYHFTDLWCIDDIVAEGLKPAFDDDAHIQLKNVVWLTPRDDQQGMWRNPKEIRITLVIPSTDRRLVRWADWARKHDPDLHRIAVNLGHTGWETFYCYFGIVPVSYSRAVECADPERRAEATERFKTHPEFG
jgi:hypothetical protein